MRVDTRDFKEFSDFVQSNFISNNELCLNPHLVREIWENTDDYDSALDGVSRLEQEILNGLVEQEDKAFEGRIANL